MAAEAGTGHVARMCSLTSKTAPIGKETCMWEEASWKSCSTWCWQTDVADNHSSGEQLMLYSSSFHVSLKARKRPFR